MVDIGKNICTPNISLIQQKKATEDVLGVFP